MAAKRASVDDEVARVRAAGADPRSPSSTAVLTAALQSKHAPVVAAAAALIKGRTLEGFTPALQAAWGRFGEDGVKRDPGCRARLAILEALDFTESMNEEPFLAAAELRQLEPAWGPPVDTAVQCRGRAVLALTRQRHPDAVLVAGSLLADAEAQVRLTAAEALGAGGVREAAGVLLHKLAVGDEDPLVLLTCMGGVLALAPEVGLRRLVPLLAEGSGERRELAALALGQSNRADACGALVLALEGCVRSVDRAPLLRALGVHRSDAAVEALLEVVGGANEVDAAAAVKALAPRRFEPGVRARVAAAVAGRPALERELAQAFQVAPE